MSSSACGILGLTESKLCHDGWSWNEADCFHVLVASLALQYVSSMNVAGAGMNSS
jgi:hypothetical protein